MKLLSKATRLATLVVLLAAAASFAADVGDTYDKVIAEKGAPKSQIVAGPVRVLSYPDVIIKLRDDVVISVKAAPPPRASAPAAAAAPQAASPSQDTIPAVKTRLKEAMTKVNLIVNQPVATLPISSEVRPAKWNDGWFHPGAITPDFDHVDIRKSQETANYEKFEFITSNLNPGVAFRGQDVEFNANTKMFYVDRSLPKKRLTEEEMVEVNRLYRIIGTCQRQLTLMGAQP